KRYLDFAGGSMIRVPVKAKKGIYRVMRTRVPRTRTFELYRRAEAKTPDLIKEIYKAISDEVETHPEATSHRSSSLIEGIPSGWSYKSRWLKFSSSEAERRSLFEQVLWTFFFDQSDTWETSWPEPRRTDAEYVAVAGKRPVDRAPAPRPKRAAAPTPKAASRGIEAAPSAAPVAEATAQLIPGDIVKIIEGRYTGLIGQIVEIRVVGKFNRFTVRLPGDDQYYDVPNFPMFALEKA